MKESRELEDSSISGYPVPMYRNAFNDEIGGRAPVTRFLVAITVVIYFIQALLERAGADVLTLSLGLSVASIMQGHFWTLLTYMLLHGGPLHLLMNMLMLFFLGGEVERALGKNHFVILYLLSGVLGGLGWALIKWPGDGVCVGSSGAIFGLLAAFALLYPHREVTLLLFLVFPITMSAWVLAATLGAFQLFMMVSPFAGGIAYSAHLAGGVAGFIYVLVLFRPDLMDKWVWRGKVRYHEYRSARHAVARDRDRKEVDRLLDKVAREGLHSLSPAERRQLEEASRQMTGR